MSSQEDKLKNSLDFHLNRILQNSQINMDDRTRHDLKVICINSGEIILNILKRLQSKELELEFKIWVYKQVLYCLMEYFKNRNAILKIETPLCEEIALEINSQMNEGIDIKGKSIKKILQDHQERNKKLRKESIAKIFDISDRIVFSAPDGLCAAIQIKTKEELVAIGEYLGHCYGDKETVIHYYNKIRNGQYKMFCLFDISKGSTNAKPIGTLKTTVYPTQIEIDELKIADNKTPGTNHRRVSALISFVNFVLNNFTRANNKKSVFVSRHLFRLKYSDQISEIRDATVILKSGEIIHVNKETVEQELSRIGINRSDILIVSSVDLHLSLYI
jgi:hypothetical protein